MIQKLDCQQKSMIISNKQDISAHKKVKLSCIDKIMQLSSKRMFCVQKINSLTHLSGVFLITTSPAKQTPITSAVQQQDMQRQAFINIGCCDYVLPIQHLVSTFACRKLTKPYFQTCRAFYFLSRFVLEIALSINKLICESQRYNCISHGLCERDRLQQTNVLTVELSTSS